MGSHSAAPVSLRALTKKFGSSVAVDGLTFDVNPGEVLGFLGPNGAGKTTAMRMLVGLSTPTSGDAAVLGYDVRKRTPEMLARIGYLPGSLALYENLTGREYLRFVARMRKRDTQSTISNLADRLNLDLDKHIHDLSKGNRQKVGVISAFMHEPDVLILDEPTSGLDPVVKREFESMLEDAKLRGVATLLSSHILSEVEHLSNRVAIIHHGRLKLLDDVVALRSRAIRQIEFEFSGAVNPEAFRLVDGVRDVLAFGNRLECHVTGNVGELMRVAVAHDAIGVRTDEQRLDDIFLDLIERGETE